jgi:hypothetical protein
MTETQTNLRGLILAVARPKNPDPDAPGLLADLLDDLGQGDLATKIREAKDNIKHIRVLDVHGACLERGVLRWEDETSYKRAVAYHRAMDNLDLATVPVVTRDKHINRKERAALLRGLLRRLKIPHVSVTAERYAFATSVDVRLPAWPQPGRDDTWHQDIERMDELLAVAFPSHVRPEPVNPFYREGEPVIWSVNCHVHWDYD